MVELVEVSHDPFASSVKMTPVDHDPFTAMAVDQAPQPAAESEFRKVLSGMGEGLREQVATPGAVMQQNPYPEGSEEASWFEDQRASTAANWAPGMALNMIGAGTPFAKPGTAGVSGGRLARYDQALARGEITKAEYEGFKAALPPDEMAPAWKGNEQFPDKSTARVELNRTTRVIERLWKKQQAWAEGGPKLTEAERAEILDAFKQKQKAQEYLTSTQPPDFEWLDAYPEKK